MRRSRSPILPLLAGAILTTSASAALAQTQEFSVQRFQPAPGANNFLGVETLRMEGDLRWSVGLFFNYSLDPFRVTSCRTTTDCNDPKAVNIADTHVVRNMFTWDLLASLSPTRWLQVGLRLPVSYVTGDGLDLTTGGPLFAPHEPFHAFAVGDPYIEAKARVFGKLGSPIALGVGGDLAFAAHKSDATNFIGDSSPVTGGVRGIVDGVVGGFSYAANLRALIRKDVTVGATTVGPEMRYGVAAGYRFSPIFEVMAEGFGGTGFRKSAGSNSLEIDGAVRILPLDSGVAITAGGGAGVLKGVGVPAARAFAGIMYSREKGDRDHDGIPDDLDKCPTIPEDFDGFEDHDGCPEDDNDNDKIPDVRDKCPNTPENVNGYQDADGCPDEPPDRDKDGIPDDADKCPDAGGPDVIRVPQHKWYGCPDRDHDGIPDINDKCPDVPEPTDDLADGSGCPHVRDTDKDGIPDDNDKCPTEPETYNGYQDEDGCPDKGPTVVEIKGDTIAIHDRVEFATGRDKIEGAKSFQVLDAVAGILVAHKELLGVEVQGHTDNAGNAAQNRTLSQKRAEAVVKYLAKKGVEPGRLVPKGYGPDQPIADNKSAAGRQKNRRVEFHILKSSQGPATPPPAAPPPPPAAPPPLPPAAPPPAAPAGTPRKP
jgi:outer membrane protein OmpA-like peptidoglycan-associated protein